MVLAGVASEDADFIVRLELVGVDRLICVTCRWFVHDLDSLYLRRVIQCLSTATTKCPTSRIDTLSLRISRCVRMAEWCHIQKLIVTIREQLNVYSAITRLGSLCVSWVDLEVDCLWQGCVCLRWCYVHQSDSWYFAAADLHLKLLRALVSLSNSWHIQKALSVCLELTCLVLDWFLGVFNVHLDLTEQGHLIFASFRELFIFVDGTIFTSWSDVVLILTTDDGNENLIECVITLFHHLGCLTALLNFNHWMVSIKFRCSLCIEHSWTLITSFDIKLSTDVSRKGLFCYTIPAFVFGTLVK